MQAFDIWHKLHLRGSKVICSLLLLVLGSGFAAAQYRSTPYPHNLPNYDDKLLHYGFLLGLNQSGFRMVQSQEFVNAQSDTIQSVYPQSGLGFSLGFIVNLRWRDQLDLRLLPTVSFYERRIRFNLKGEEDPLDAIFEASVVQFPLLLKYKSMRRGDHRFYVVGGLAPSVQVGRKKEKGVSDENQLVTQRFDLTLETGIGMDIYFPFFKFAPELRFSYGLLNVFDKEDKFLSRNIDRLSTYTVTVLFLFE